MTRQGLDWNMDYVVKTYTPCRFPLYARFDLQWEGDAPFDFVVLPKPKIRPEMEQVFTNLMSHPIDTLVGTIVRDGVQKKLYVSQIPLSDNIHDIVRRAMFLVEIPRNFVW